MYPLGRPTVALFRGVVIAEIVLTILLTLLLLVVSILLGGPEAEELTTSEKVDLISILLTLVIFFPRLSLLG